MFAVVPNVRRLSRRLSPGLAVVLGSAVFAIATSAAAQDTAAVGAADQPEARAEGTAVGNDARDEGAEGASAAEAGAAANESGERLSRRERRRQAEAAQAEAARAEAGSGSQAETAAAATAPGSELVCRSERPTGSRMPIRTCKTAAAWEGIDAAKEQAAEDFLRRGAESSTLHQGSAN